MARLFRPAIPVRVKCIVVLRQIGETFPERIVAENDGRLRQLLTDRLLTLCVLLRCSFRDLRLDHDPPLGARKRTGEGRRTIYDPPANDPDHLFYRPHGTQFEGSHDVKTRLRGDHGQYSDIVLIKRQRRREREEKPVKRLKRDVDSGRKIKVWRRRSPGLSPCARARNGLPCHCKADAERWRRRKVACGNWRTTKIQNRSRSTAEKDRAPAKAPGGWGKKSSKQ